MDCAAAAIENRLYARKPEEASRAVVDSVLQGYLNDADGIETGDTDDAYRHVKGDRWGDQLKSPDKDQVAEAKQEVFDFLQSTETSQRAEVAGELGQSLNLAAALITEQRAELGLPN